MSATIDEILDLISFAGAELVNGNANHGPMAAEALYALGRDEAALPWVESYRDRLTHRPAPTARIPREDWREHLGKRDRLGDWIQFFRNELAEHPWQRVIREWVPRLAPGLMAAAAHGLGTRITTRWQYCYDEVAELLGVPDDFDIMALIPLGYPLPPEHLGGSRRRPVPEIAFLDKWGAPWGA